MDESPTSHMGSKAIRLHWLKPPRCSPHRLWSPHQRAEKQRQLHYLVTRRWPLRQHTGTQRQLKPPCLDHPKAAAPCHHRAGRRGTLGTHSRTHCSTLFLCSFQKHNIADMVQTGTDLPFPPEPSVNDIAFKACCSRIFVVMPGMIFRRP